MSRSEHSPELRPRGSERGSDHRTLAVIPARLGSERLPRKPLLRDTGLYLFEHVFHRVRAARRIEAVLVATDAEEILVAAEEVGVPAVLTDARHPSGTDRILEVARNHPEFDLIVNVQGDEPEIDPAHLDRLVEELEAGAEVATLAAPIRSPAEMERSSVVKVVCDEGGRALYFSRSPIPFDRGAGAGAWRSGLRHVGVYAFRRETLLRFGSWPPAQLERTEALEQLRLLAHGVPIAVLPIERAPHGIDTPEDYAHFLEQWRREHPAPTVAAPPDPS